MIGTTLGNFEIHTLLGRGGMGEVYQAKDRKLGRDVAIKVLPEEFAKDADRVARFQREAKLLASLNHPNIAAICGFWRKRHVIGKERSSYPRISEVLQCRKRRPDAWYPRCPSPGGGSGKRD